ncbi:MAG TPA: hypothetical protein PLD20_10660 [Blastocatellia bacterium]|nr:hypothetical protein [Blastocatellia bacterium]HMV85365.1 hypothetical protein [Blastocatellia bacterium]HMZ18381.1 hypothetical protein [Blastocatellia bacterium]HNG30076.1 hypothetical protein [Blastocatellia bacterium]
MQTSHNFFSLWFKLPAIIALFWLTAPSARAGDPGEPFPSRAASGDQRPGSMLVYNVYTSSSSNFNSHNSRIALTNSSDSVIAYVHLFFIEGATCSVSDSFICLTPNQTATFLASDIDPGITGYLIALAVSQQGCPVRHNSLLGDVYVKFPTGHVGNLAAEAFAAQYDVFTGCNASSSTATIFFDSPDKADSYNPLPRTVATDSIPDRASGNDTMLVLNRIGGNLGVGLGGIGSIVGLLYDDGENGVSFTFNTSSCQFRSSLSNNFPRTAPRFEVIISAGHSGWMKLYADNASIGLLGATLNSNAGSNASAGAFTGTRNLHHLTFNNSSGGSAVGLIVPVFPPAC